MTRIIALLLICVAGLESTIFLPMDSTSVMNANLSSGYQNRISVYGDRITKVVYAESDIQLVLDKDIGHLFVYSLTPFPGKTIVTLVTEGGLVQDLEFTFTEKPSEIVILEHFCEEDMDCEDEICEEMTLFPGHPDYMVMVVEGVLSGTVPQGFVACETTTECRKIKKGVQAFLVSKLVSLEETVYVWRIESTSRWNQSLSEREMNFQRGIWIYLDKNKLGPKEQIIGIVGVKNHV